MFSKKKKLPPPIVVKTTIVQGRSQFDTYDEYTITVEGSGFVGQGMSMSVSSAFQEAYDNFLSHMAGTILSQ